LGFLPWILSKKPIVILRRVSVMRQSRSGWQIAYRDVHQGSNRKDGA
jgi:hypothetical protein